MLHKEVSINSNTQKEDPLSKEMSLDQLCQKYQNLVKDDFKL